MIVERVKDTIDDVLVPVVVSAAELLVAIAMLVESTPQPIVIRESRRSEPDSLTPQSSLALPIHHLSLFMRYRRNIFGEKKCRPSIDCICLIEIGTNETLAFEARRIAVERLALELRTDRLR